MHLFIFEVQAQTSPGVNNWPGSCSCINFRYLCSGKDAFLPNGHVQFYCDQSSSLQSLSFPFNSFCAPPWICRDKGVCLKYGNWHICSFDGCDALIYQTLPLNPSINGTIIGSWPLVGHVGTAECIGSIYTGPLNNINSRTKLAICPGDDVELTIPGFSLPDSSGLCLRIRIMETDSTEVISNSFQYNHVQGNTVNLTNMFSVLETDIYIIEMELVCCGEPAGCTLNTYKSAFIELSGPLSYQASMHQGGGTSGCDPINVLASPEFPGPAFVTPLEVEIDGDTISIIRNCPVNFTLSNIVNPEGVDIAVDVIQIDCETQIGNFLFYSDTITHDTSINTISFPVSPNSLETKCSCFRIELTYDGCDESTITDTYYYRIGDDCEEEFHDPDLEKAFLLPFQPNDQNLYVRPNPVVQELNIDIPDLTLSGENELQIFIFDSSGKQVYFSRIPSMEHTHVIHLDIVPGIYHYLVSGNQYSAQGKFVKQ